MKHSIRPLFIVAVLVASEASAATTIYEEAESDRDLTPRNSLVFTNLPSALPAGTVSLVVDLWCADENEERFWINLRGGKGANGKLAGYAGPQGGAVDTFHPNGTMRFVFPVTSFSRALDPKAISDVKVGLCRKGATGRFGVERILALAKGEKGPEIVTPPLRHVADVAEHATDFVKFKDECACGDFVIGWATSMENVRPRGGFLWRKPDKVGVRLARGEFESVQILVAPNGKDLKDVTVQVEGDLKPVESSKLKVQSGENSPTPPLLHFAATNVAANVVGYTETKEQAPYLARMQKRHGAPPTGWWPDPILDFQKSCDISGTDVQSFWVRVKCPRDQVAGIYEGALVVSAQGAKPVRLPFTVRVYDFEVGRASPLPLAITFAPRGKNKGVVTNDYHSAWMRPGMEEAYCDFLADYYITWDSLYYNAVWTGPKWDMLLRLKEQGRLGLFNLGYWDYAASEQHFRGGKGFAEKRARYEKAKELGLLDHAYFYGCDESSAGLAEKIALAARILKEEFPGVPLITTAKDTRLGTGDSKFGFIDIYSPLTCRWNPALVEKARRAGRQVWWYFCCDPAWPWANAMIESIPCEMRSLMGAQTQKFKPEGFLYWTISRWMSDNPIKSGPFTDWEATTIGKCHGDGQWTCCGGPDDMVLSTLRLENFRDGLDDLWYCRILEEKVKEVERLKFKVESSENKVESGGKDIKDSKDSKDLKGLNDPSRRKSWLDRARKALAVPKEVVESPRSFATKPDVIYGWRDGIAELIEEALP